MADGISDLLSLFRVLIRIRERMKEKFKMILYHIEKKEYKKENCKKK